MFAAVGGLAQKFQEHKMLHYPVNLYCLHVFNSPDRPTGVKVRGQQPVSVAS